MSNQTTPEEILAAILCCIHEQGRREVSTEKKVAPMRQPTQAEIRAHLGTPEARAILPYAEEIIGHLSVDVAARLKPTDAFRNFAGSVKRETDRIEDAVGSLLGLPSQGRR